jgi:hypothetical protein
MKRLRRVFKTGIDYVWIYETHTDGAFHLHIIVSGLSERVARVVYRSGSIGFVPASSGAKKDTWSIKTWWKKTLSKCGCGYIADIQRLDSRQAALYVTNYMTKSQQNYYIKNMRRIQTSRAIGSPKPENVMKWQTSSLLWGGNVGHEPVKDLDLRVTVPASYWNDNYVYPRDTHEVT